MGYLGSRVWAKGALPKALTGLTGLQAHRAGSLWGRYHKADLLYRALCKLVKNYVFLTNGLVSHRVFYPTEVHRPRDPKKGLTRRRLHHLAPIAPTRKALRVYVIDIIHIALHRLPPTQMVHLVQISHAPRLHRLPPDCTVCLPIAPFASGHLVQLYTRSRASRNYLRHYVNYRLHLTEPGRTIGSQLSGDSNEQIYHPVCPRLFCALPAALRHI